MFWARNRSIFSNRKSGLFLCLSGIASRIVWMSSHLCCSAGNWRLRDRSSRATVNGGAGSSGRSRISLVLDQRFIQIADAQQGSGVAKTRSPRRRIGFGGPPESRESLIRIAELLIALTEEDVGSGVGAQ